jgi:hypothetical protein
MRLQWRQLPGERRCRMQRPGNTNCTEPVDHQDATNWRRTCNQSIGTPSIFPAPASQRFGSTGGEGYSLFGLYVASLEGEWLIWHSNLTSINQGWRVMEYLIPFMPPAISKRTVAVWQVDQDNLLLFCLQQPLTRISEGNTVNYNCFQVCKTFKSPFTFLDFTH